jgi:hypothetical protein
MSRHRPTPRRHHASSHFRGSPSGRPKEDLDGAARMSCTRRRRGAPWPPASAPWGRRQSASAVEPQAPASRPANASTPSAPSVLPSLSFSWWRRKRRGGGCPAGRRPPTAAARIRKEGPAAGLLSTLAAAAASLTGRRAHRPGCRQTEQ